MALSADFRTTKKGIQLNWGTAEKAMFQKLKDMLCIDTVHAHFDLLLPIAISCDTSEVGLGAVLFHCYEGKIQSKPWLSSLLSKRLTFHLGDLTTNLL